MGRYAAVATLAVTLALTGGTTSLAHAAAPACKTVVTDDAGVLSPAQLTALTKHAAGLATKTELRIRTEKSLFTGSLNGDEGSLQQDCGWATRSGVRQPRLLVIMVATEDRQMGIYPGTALVGTITRPVWLSIEQKDMRPHFAKADWVGGLEAAVDALSATVTAAAAAPSPPASAPATSSAAAPSATTAESSAAQAPIQYDSNGNIIQGDGSAEHPFITDPNGVLPGSPTSTGAGSNVWPAIGIIAGVVVIGMIALIGTVIGVARSGSSRRRGHYGPDGAWINAPFDGGSHLHNPGMFGGGGFGGGGFGGGDSGGGGGSSSDGGGGFVRLLVLFPVVRLVDQHLDVLGQRAVDDVGERGVLEHLAQAGPYRDPDRLQVCRLAVVLQHLRAHPAHVRHRALDRPDHVGDGDVGGMQREPVAALGTPLAVHQTSPAQ